MVRISETGYFKILKYTGFFLRERDPFWETMYVGEGKRRF